MNGGASLESFRRLLDSSFDYFVVVDEEQMVRHMSEHLVALCDPDRAARELGSSPAVLHDYIDE